jgi:arylsulfatase A-like enzyme
MVDVGVDMMPTLLDLCGIAPPSEMQGQSYLPVLDSKASNARDSIWYQVFTQTGGNPGEYAPYAQRGIRTKEWLYVRHKNERVILIDELADPEEQINLVSNPEHTTLMDNFDKQIEQHMQQSGDDWDMAADFPPPDFLTHAEAKEHLENVLLPSAIHVP